MAPRLALLITAALVLAGCGGSNRYGTGNPIAGYTDCDILAAQGSTLCDDVYNSESVKKTAQ